MLASAFKMSLWGLIPALPPWLGIAVFMLVVVVAGASFVRNKITVASSALFALVVAMGAFMAALIGLL